MKNFLSRLGKDLKIINVGPDAGVKEGVGGWLLFFIVLNLVSSVAANLSELNTIGELQVKYPAVSDGFNLYLGIMAVYAIINIFSLYSLAVVRKGAITFIKVLLIIKPFFYLLAPLLQLACMEVMHPGNNFLSASVIQGTYASPVMSIPKIAWIFFNSGLWYWYFSASRRVQKTWAKYNR